MRIPITFQGNAPNVGIIRNHVLVTRIVNSRAGEKMEEFTEETTLITQKNHNIEKSEMTEANEENEKTEKTEKMRRM